MSNILIILGNPKKKSLCKSLADAYEKGAILGGHKVKRVDVRDLKFDPVLWEGYGEGQELEKNLVDVQKNILWAEHLVFVYPSWWSGMPAIFKGFFDRVFLADFAFRFHKGKFLPEKLLKGKSARLIVTMDSPYLIYQLFFGAPGNKIIKRGILNFSGVSPVRITNLCRVRESSDEKRAKWLKKVEELGNLGR